MAATAFSDYGPFDAGTGANRTEAWWRDYARHFLTNGVLNGEQNELEAFGDSTGLQVKVRTGRIFIRSHWAKLTSETTLAIDSNSSGNPRIDRVVARVDAANNVVELDVIKGTPAGSPVAPTVATGASDIWEVSLAQVAVANGASTISAANVTDERTYAMAGGSPYLSTRVYRATALSCTNDTLTDMAFGTLDYTDLTGRFHSTSTNPDRLLAPFAGRYQLHVAVEFDTNATGYRLVTALKNGTTDVAPPVAVNAITGRATPVLLDVPEIVLAAGDYVRIRVRQNSGGSLNVLGTSSSPTGTTHAIWRYLGA
jgi:hypothetical protein